MFKTVLLLLFSVLCVVYTQSDGPSHSRSYMRVKRGRYYPGPPTRFYNYPPMTFPIRGPFSYTPPPFMANDEPQYPGSRPYKVSKRPINEGLGDNDINNLVNNLSKQDLDKILEIAYEKDKYTEKTKDIDYGYSRPYERENTVRPSFTKDTFRETDTKYKDEKPYETEFKKYINYVTAISPTVHGPQEQSTEYKVYSPQNNPTEYKVYTPQNKPTEYHDYPQQEQPTSYNLYSLPDNKILPATDTIDSLGSQTFTNQVPSSYPVSSNAFFSENTDEENLPPPVNMRDEDFDVSYTNNVPTVVKAESSSYKVENFGDLPLMNYNSKLHSVSSYHVPHYTITQPKQSPQSPSASLSSFSSSQSISSSSSALLKPSPAAAAIKAPPYEPAPPVSAAKEQSDAHLKATKIWSHKSKGAAYTLHDDGSLTPERPRPKYG